MYFKTSTLLSSYPVLFWLLLGAQSFFVHSQAYGQSTTQGDSTTKYAPMGIPIDNISTETTFLLQAIDHLNSLLEAQETAHESDSIISKKLAYIQEVKEEVKKNGIDNSDYFKAQGLKTEITPIRVLYETSITSLSSRIKALAKGLETLTNQDERWQLTAQRAAEENWTPAIQDRIRTNITEIKTLRRKTKVVYDQLLSTQDQYTMEMIYLDELSRRIQLAESQYTSLILMRNDVTIWELFKTLDPTTPFRERFQKALERERRVLALFYASYKTNLYYHALIFIFLLGVLFLIKRDISTWSDEARDGDVKHSLFVINHPFSTAILIAVFFNRVLYPQASSEALEYFRVLLIIPIVALIPGIYYTVPRRYFIYLGLLFLALMSVGQFQDFPVLDRFAALTVSILMIIFLTTLLATRAAFEKESTKFNWKLVEVIAKVCLAFCALSILANVLGNTVLTEILLNGVFALIFGGLIIFSGRRAIKSLFALVLQHKRVAPLNIIVNHKEKIKRVFQQLLTIALVTLWVVVVFDNFMVLTPLLDWLTGVLTTPWQFGSLEVTLGSLLGFIFTLWLTIIFSKFVRFLLQEEVLPRFYLSRGVSGAISLLVRLGLLAIGFTIALGVAKVELSKITILIGALGVGIGFGLQNIFNNLISGLILAFERPLQVGDIIQISTLNITGEVKEIGLRASIIRSFDGAEVVVPNGNLISNEMINWTLSDKKRRQEIIVGVAYGTDTTRALALLNTIIQGEELALKDPSPLIIFSGFGESSLDFRVLFWTHFENGIVAKSTIGLAIDNAFKEAGITIPFPQRDVHVSSAAAGSTLS